jgi:hypothetical protein
MNQLPSPRLFLILLLLLWIAACVGTQTFTPIARPGDTVALAVGRQNLFHENLTVTITPSSGPSVTYSPNDSRVRGIINLYPDPSSGLVVGSSTNQDLGNNDNGIGSAIQNLVTRDSEWWQTMILLDLPSTLPIGSATVSFVDSAGARIGPATVQVLSGTGNSNLFNVYLSPGGGGSTDFLSNYPGGLSSMETSARYKVTFNTYLNANGAEVIPHSLQVEFTRTPGVGVPYVVNPRDDIKNVVWTDDGTNLKVMVTPTNGQTLSRLGKTGNMPRFRFYIAGGITGLTQTNLKAYDVNGNPMSGVTANIQ